MAAMADLPTSTAQYSTIHGRQSQPEGPEHDGGEQADRSQAHPTPYTDLEELRFVYKLPPISERQLAIVKLVARYSALDDSFAESHPEFDFAHASHSLHALYTAFVKQYKLLCSGARPLDGSVLERAAIRAERNHEQPSAQNTQSTHAALGQSAVSRSGLATIDWQDFVVLETVEFFSADVKGASRLSAPFSREEVTLHKEQTTRKRHQQEPMYKSPYTGELVSASQFEEHMRVHALDPTWRKQRAVEEERQISNLDVQGAAANLARLQEKRRKLLDEES